MKNIIITLLIIFLFATGSLLLHVQNVSIKNLEILEVTVNNLERNVAETVTHLYITKPELFFNLVSEHPEWEEIDAVPYSKCYRHLIGTTTYDHIFCTAI